MGNCFTLYSIHKLGHQDGNLCSQVGEANIMISILISGTYKFNNDWADHEWLSDITAESQKLTFLANTHSLEEQGF